METFCFLTTFRSISFTNAPPRIASKTNPKSTNSFSKSSKLTNANKNPYKTSTRRSPLYSTLRPIYWKTLNNFFLNQRRKPDQAHSVQMRECPCP